MSYMAPEAFGALFVVVVFGALIIAALIDLGVERWQHHKSYTRPEYGSTKRGKTWQ